MDLENYQNYILRNYSLKNKALIQIYAKYDLMIKFYANFKTPNTIMKGPLNLFHYHDCKIDPEVSSIEVSLTGNTTFKKFLKNMKTAEVMETDVYKFKWLRLEEIKAKDSEEKMYRVFVESLAPISYKFYVDVTLEKLTDMSWAMEDDGGGLYYSIGRAITDKFIQFVEFRGDRMKPSDYDLISTLLPKANEFTIENSMEQLLKIKNFKSKHTSEVIDRWKSYEYMDNKKYSKPIGELIEIMSQILKKP